MIGRDTILGRHVTEHRRGLPILAAHDAIVVRSRRAVDPLHVGFFSKLLTR
jgi:hypothetical protein